MITPNHAFGGVIRKLRIIDKTQCGIKRHGFLKVAHDQVDENLSHDSVNFHESNMLHIRNAMNGPNFKSTIEWIMNRRREDSSFFEFHFLWAKDNGCFWCQTKWQYPK